MTRSAARRHEREEPTLREQPHGGALLPGGKPGNRGGIGRPKEELRAMMRADLPAALAAVRALVQEERLAHDALEALLTDPRIEALPDDVRYIVAEAAAEHLTAKAKPRELIQALDVLARYGIGTQHEEERRETQVQYVVRLPARAEAPPSAAPGAPALLVGPPVAVVPPPLPMPALEEER